MSGDPGQHDIELAARLLTEADNRGSLADRDAALVMAFEALQSRSLAPIARGRLAVAAGAALRRRWRTAFVRDDLESAVHVLSHAEERLAGEQGWAAVASELARAHVEVAVALETKTLQVKEDENPPTMLEVAVHAARLARGAVAATIDRAPEERADAAFALGSALWLKSDLQEAAVWLRRSVETFEIPAARLLLARTHATLFDLGQDAADLDQARSHLDSVAGCDAAPREAFEAARFWLMWAADRAEWEESADAGHRALDLRERLRRSQQDETRERHWLIEVGGVPSLAAYALVKADRAGEAVAALDRSLFTEVVDRLGRPAHLDTEYRPEGIAATAEYEPLVYLAATPHGGVAVTVSGSAIDATPLRGLTRTALHEREEAYLSAYGEWRWTNGADGLDRWKRELEVMTEWLWSEVMEDVVARLPNGAATVVTDGILGLLPLHAASGDGTVAIERLQMRVAPNATMLAVARRRVPSESGGEGLVVAAADAPNQDPLQYASAEAYAITALMRGAELLTGQHATVESVAHRMGGRRVLHFACHGRTRFDDPGLSELILGDGAALTLARILEMRLLSARLTVLSACESGLTEIVVPEEKMSLPAGLMLAGTAGVIASLWAVNDRSTMLLMARLYQVIAAGADPCAALRTAQLWLRDTSSHDMASWSADVANAMATAGAPDVDVSVFADALRPYRHVEFPFRHPYHWAPFVYFGA